MMRREMKKLLFWVIILSLFFFENSDAESEIKFNHIFRDSGLSGNSVLNIFQDSQGFIWFGTNAGLNRFDGYRFRVYSPEEDDPGSISGYGVFSIIEDHEGFLWIGTRDDGLNRFDRNTEIFVHFQHDSSIEHSLIHNNVYCVLEDSLKNLWLGTMGGLDRFDRKGNRFVHHLHRPDDPRSISNNNITWLYEAPSEPGVLWITTAGSGLNRFDIHQNTFKSYRQNPKNQDSISSDLTLAVCEDSNGFLWVCTNKGLNRFDRRKQVFKRFGHDPLNSDSLSFDHTFYVTTDKHGRLWVGTMGGGVSVGDPESGRFIRLLHDPDDDFSISNNEVNHIFVDHTGIVWVGTVWGLNRYDPREHSITYLRHIPHLDNSLSANQIVDIREDQSGYRWFATNHGITRFHPSTEKFDQFFNIPSQENSLSSNTTFCVYPDTDGSIWMGTLNGLDHFEPNTNRFSHFRHDPRRSSSLSHDRVLSVCRDRGGHLWVGTWIGLNRSRERVGEFDRFFDKPGNPGEWYKFSFSTIFEDNSGDLWFGTRGGGLYRYHAGVFTHMGYRPDEVGFLPSNHINIICQDRKDRLWIGTSEGICLVSGENRFESVAINEGGFNTSVKGIVEDDHGYLWLSTSQGVVRFNPDTRKFKKILQLENLKVNEFLSDSCLLGKNGEILFGSMEGIISFSPGDITSNPHKPPVVITGVTLYGSDRKGVSISAFSGEIDVAHRDFPLHLEFAALNYSNPSRNQYAYKIDGLNDRWIFIENKNELTLTQLDPGIHAIRIKGSNNDGLWNEEGTVLRIRVLPPFWKTWWFRLILVAGVLLIIIAWHRTRMKRLSRRLKTEAALERYLLKHDITDREREIVLLILKGKSNKEIEDALFISLGTVKNHIYNIYNKLNVRSRVQFLTLFKNLEMQSDTVDSKSHYQI